MLVHDVVAGVYGEDAGFVDVVLRVRVAGADAQLVLGGQAGDGAGLGGAGVCAGKREAAPQVVYLAARPAKERKRGPARQTPSRRLKYRFRLSA